jgi:hypothetical protein
MLRSKLMGLGERRDCVFAPRWTTLTVILPSINPQKNPKQGIIEI